VELSKNRFHDREVFVSHANAALTPKARLALGQLIVDSGWSVSAAAHFYRVSWPTAKRWADRYQLLRETQPVPVLSSQLNDRSSRPLRSPRKTPQPLVRKIVHLRWRKRLGPVAIAGKLGMPASTVHAVLVRCRVNKLWHVDRRTGEPIRRYEHLYPGSLVHVDVKKLGNIPDGGGWRYVGRKQGNRNKALTPGVTRPKHGHLQIGTAYVHSVLDDHSRVVYSEIHNDEKATTAAAVLHRATAWFQNRGVRIERVLSDNGACYRGFVWRDTCAELGIEHRRTQPYRPQTNGKIERFHRTLADGWAYGRL
jgi:transposase InsO family protein